MPDEPNIAPERSLTDRERWDGVRNVEVERGDKDKVEDRNDIDDVNHE